MNAEALSYRKYRRFIKTAEPSMRFLDNVHKPRAIRAKHPHCSVDIGRVGLVVAVISHMLRPQRIASWNFPYIAACV